ncbi:MAG: nuclear transport factor 2 family protein [Casimicrobiaceae bacterium]
MSRRIILIATCAALAACASLAPGYSDVSLENLFNAEREFAADGYARGLRASFVAHFAPDAIVFQPGPQKYADLVKDQPAPADPTAVRLEWAPQAGAVSRAGDIGFTTGPLRISRRDQPKAPASYGHFLSVWSHASGKWQVVVDAGVAQKSPPPQEGVPNMRTPIRWQASATLADAARLAHRDELFAIERAPRSFGSTTGDVRSYADLITPSTRVLRDNEPMLTGDALAANVTVLGARHVEWTPIDGGVAASDDLAYTYGSVRESSGATAPVDGYYVHVWQRDLSAHWKLIAEVVLPQS